MTLNNHVALIIGAGSGIGKATALLFAENSAKLILLDIDQLSGEKLESVMLQMGYQVKFIKCDIS